MHGLLFNKHYYEQPNDAIPMAFPEKQLLSVVLYIDHIM